MLAGQPFLLSAVIRDLRLAGSLLSALLLCAGTAAAADVTVEPSDEGMVVKVDGDLFTEYITRSLKKPILWPIIGPGGHEMTRAFPMEPGEGERRDHPHQRSLWFTHGNVNGVDFWGETRGRGEIIHREFRRAEGGEVGVIETANDWQDAEGNKLLEDVRTLHFRASEEQRIIDFDITLTASEGPVVFGDTKEGTMGLRVASSMDVEQRGDRSRGTIVNSAGQTNRDAWGKQAPWVDYYGPVDGDIVGAAIMNHPQSFRYPTYWHVREYGLFAANPFGLHDFLGVEEPQGRYELPAGGSITLRYRFLFHLGDTAEGRIAEAFREYSTTGE